MQDTGLLRTRPLKLGAAATVMLVTLASAGALGVLLTHGRTDMTDTTAAQKGASAADGARQSAPRVASQGSVCASCGTVVSIRVMTLKGDVAGPGAVAGGVAAAGNEIETNPKQRHSYRVTVRMDDGSFRTVSQRSPPAVAIGERVRVVDSTVLARS